MGKRNKWIPYFFAAPPFLILMLFVYVPIVQNLRLSFFEWNAFTPVLHYVGFQNYKNLFSDAIFHTALKNNVLYAFISVVFQVGGGLILAAILEDKVVRRFSPVFRTVFFLPAIISATVIAILFDFVYNPQIGLLNQFLNAVGLDSLTRAWLGNSSTAIYSVMAVSQWKSIGYIAVFFIVAIQNIPSELYEAAEIDGAGKISRFFSVTVPQVKEMTFITTAITITESFTIFNEPFMLTGGGPGDSSQVLATYIYKSAFNNNEMGYAVTISTIVLLIILLISIIQLKVFKTGREDN